MWSLQSVKDENCCYYFLNGAECSVGRKNAYILILKDPSISRQHAVLKVTHPEENVSDPSKLPVLKLKDTGSKYGTFKNNDRLGDAEEILQNGDAVKFGQFEGEFRVCLTPLVVTTSCIAQSKKETLKKVVRSLGGHLVPEWRPTCTHLVMSDVKVTVKALCCLISLKPLVSPEYFTDLLKSYQNKTSVPKANEYIPPIGEALIEQTKVSFDVISERKQIFKGKTFIFLDEKQYKKLHLAVTTGGGHAVILDESKAFANDFIMRDESCVIQPLGEITKNEKTVAFVKKIAYALHKKKKRMIPESEFGLSVAYCSTERFCNPEFDIGSALLGTPKLPSQTLSQHEVYVPDTEVQTQISHIAMKERPPIIEETTLSKKSSSRSSLINQTVEESQENLFDKKRKLYSCNSDNISFGDETSSSVQITKKIKIETASSSAIQLTEPQGATTKNTLFSMPVKQEQASTSTMQVHELGEPEMQNDVEILSDEGSTVQNKHNNEEAISEKAQGKCTSSVNGKVIAKVNGFHSATLHNGTVPKRGDQDLSSENMPRNLCQVLVANLVKRMSNPAVPLSDINGNKHCESSKNFKKFKKVLPVATRAFPKIIGGHELVPHNKLVSKAIGDWLNLHPESQDQAASEDCGEFDWDSQVSKKRKR